MSNTRPHHRIRAAADLRSALTRYEAPSPMACAEELCDALSALVDVDDGAAELLTGLRALLGAYEVRVARRIPVAAQAALALVDNTTETRFRALEQLEERVRERIKWAGADDGYDVDRAVEMRSGL